jgi:hypothetical protein
VSEQLREDRIQDVMHTFDWLEGDGYAPVVDQNGRAVVMGVEGPLDLDEFLELGRTRGPLVADLYRQLNETDEGRGLLREAYQRWQEEGG